MALQEELAGSRNAHGGVVGNLIIAQQPRNGAHAIQVQMVIHDRARRFMKADIRATSRSHGQRSTEAVSDGAVEAEAAVAIDGGQQISRSRDFSGHFHVPIASGPRVIRVRVEGQPAAQDRDLSAEIQMLGLLEDGAWSPAGGNLAAVREDQGAIDRRRIRWVPRHKVVAVV